MDWSDCAWEKEGEKDVCGLTYEKGGAVDRKGWFGSRAEEEDGFCFD